MITPDKIMDLLCVVRPNGVPAEDYPAIATFLAAGLQLSEEGTDDPSSTGPESVRQADVDAAAEPGDGQERVGPTRDGRGRFLRASA